MAHIIASIVTAKVSSALALYPKECILKFRSLPPSPPSLSLPLSLGHFVPADFNVRQWNWGFILVVEN